MDVVIIIINNNIFINPFYVTYSKRYTLLHEQTGLPCFTSMLGKELSCSLVP